MSYLTLWFFIIWFGSGVPPDGLLSHGYPTATLCEDARRSLVEYQGGLDTRLSVGCFQLPREAVPG